MDEQPPDISDPETLENDMSKEAMLEILQRLKIEHRAIDSFNERQNSFHRKSARPGYYCLKRSAF